MKVKKMSCKVFLNLVGMASKYTSKVSQTLLEVKEKKRDCSKIPIIEL
jgi:hypothetical protein